MSGSPLAVGSDETEARRALHQTLNEKHVGLGVWLSGGVLSQHTQALGSIPSTICSILLRGYSSQKLPSNQRPPSLVHQYIIHLCRD